MNRPSEETPIKVCIAGDMAPIERAVPLFINGDVEGIFGDVLPHLQNADIAVANLEAPLFDIPTPANKEGRVIGAPVGCINGLRKTGFSALGIANNHVMDHGVAGLETTLRAAGEVDLPLFGAGTNLDAAGEPVVIEAKGKKIAFIGMAEDEFCLATETEPGAFPFDAMYFVEHHLRTTLKTADYVIALVHSGREMYPYPSPNQQRLSRFLVNEGVHAVLHQHSHTPGCYEVFKGAPIVYGQGNFVFDSKRKRKNGVLWHRGFLVELTLDGDEVSTAVVPFSQFEGECGLKKLSGEEKAAFLSDISRRCDEIAGDGFVTMRWNTFCEAYRDHYLSILHGDSKFFRSISKCLKILRFVYRDKPKIRTFNYIRRQSHREVLLTILKSGDF